MALSGLLVVCGAAFLAVFAVLTLLALVIWLITAAFPERAGTDDAAVLAAITAVVARAAPQARVTRVEEQR